MPLRLHTTTRQEYDILDEEADAMFRVFEGLLDPTKNHPLPLTEDELADLKRRRKEVRRDHLCPVPRAHAP